MRHIFIINPIAGGRDSTSRIMEAAKALQERHGIAYECILTRRPGHAMETCRALAEGGQLLSAYHDRSGRKFWIITEADRSATTLLLPDEY